MKIMSIFMAACLLLAGSYVAAQEVFIDTSGNVEIGATGTAGKLQVDGTTNQDGIVGTSSGTGAGVYGSHTNGNFGTLGESGYGVHGKSTTGDAGFFEGNAHVTGNLTVDGSITGFSESDPVFSVWDRSSGISITESQITDLTHFTNANETDPTVPASIKDGIDWTELSGKPDGLDDGDQVGITSETDPTVNSLAKASLSCGINQIAKWNGSSWACANDVSGGGGGGYAKVAVVAQSGGDYTSPVTAMTNKATWCGTPSATNPCLLKIMPGVYDIVNSSVIMSPYIDIEGSGENVTIIKGFAGGIIWGSDNAELRYLTIRGDGANPIGITSDSVAPKISHVTVDVSSANETSAIYNFYASPVIDTVTVIISVSSGNATGILSEHSSPTIENVTIDASATSGTGIGIQSTTGNIAIHNARINASTYSVVAINNSKVLIFNSRIDQPVSTLISSTVTCTGAYDSGMTLLTSACL